MSHKLVLQAVEKVTPDVNRYVFNKPEGFAFRAGQAVDIALDRDGWREELRPFTFTSLPEDDALEFTIKSYPGHEGGMTKHLPELKPGDAVLAEEPWGAIEDKGPGWFIAGGAGVTPFISILRKRLKEHGSLDGSELIFSNKTEKDIILRDEFEQMSGLKTYFTVTDQPDSDLPKRKIDRDLLADHVQVGKGKCYVCGPDQMLDDISEALKKIGVPEQDIITEEFD